MPDRTETIVAPATAPVPAGVAVVRLSGPHAHAIACALSGLPLLEHGRMVLRTLRHAGEVLDRGYVVGFAAPRTFTGQDVAELHVHGSPAVVARLCEVACELGARPAQPGEFTWRAFEQGKLDLPQAEALLDLISARGEAARQAALQHLDGRLGRRLAELRAPLLHALAEVEARLDFASEADVGLLDRGQIASELGLLHDCLAELRATARAGRVRLQGARVVLFGAPNAGKSTLLNALVEADRALVDARPGTTRDVLEATTAPNGVVITWVDTAGVRQAEDPVELQGTQRAQREVGVADVVIWLQDGSTPRADLPAPPAETVVLPVRTKADLPVHPEIADDPHFGPALAVAAVRGDGVAALRQAVVAAVQRLGEPARGEGVVLARMRHAEGLGQAQAAIQRAVAALQADWPLELVAADLRDAAQALGEVTGELAPDDVLAAIFAQFCIGK